MFKKLSKALSLLLVIAVFMSNMVIVSYAQTQVMGVDITKYKTEKDLPAIALNLREAMTERESEYVFYYKTNEEMTKSDAEEFFYNIYENAYAETTQGDEGDYLRYSVSRTGYATEGRTDGKTCYYKMMLGVEYYTNAQQEQAVEAKIEEIIAEFDFDSNTTDKAKCDKIYSYITKNVRYDNENLNDDSYNLKYTAYAALINQTAVCQGYATLFYRMAKECGLDARVISGKSYDEDHAWNIVRMDEMLYYYVDSTWDEGNNAYKYYLKGSNDFKEHTPKAEFEELTFKSKYPIDCDNYGKHEYTRTEDNFSVTYICKICGISVAEYKIPMGETLAQDTDGKWYYFVDGKKNDSSALVWYDGKLCYIDNGIWDKEISNILIFDGEKSYYIKNGVWDNTYTKIVSNGDTSFYIENGLKSNYSGFKKYNGKYYYLSNGVFNKITKFIKSGSKYYYVKDGIRSSSTGFVKYDGKYRYIVDGVWNKKTGFVKYKSKYYYVKDGIRSATTGFVKVGGEYYMIKKGVRSSTATYEKCGKAYIKISATEYTYNGKTKKPTLKIYNSEAKTISSKYYKISYSKGRKNVGKYSVSIKFKGKYSGSKKFYFTIKPDDTSVSKVTAAKKSLKVTVKKKSKQVTGYQIQYSTNKNFKSAKTKTVSSYKTTSVTLKGLSAKKTYYVRVRTYKKVGSKKYYSEWSKYKYKKTK